ncbi:MAG: MBL fold metallo-hydrolase [Wujia sp.]
MANLITELKYSNTNTYLVKGKKGYVLFDTGWAGTFSVFCKALGELNIKAQEIQYLLISHFHPDHMGIAREIANLGVTIVVMDVQREFVHSSDYIFKKENCTEFEPIDDSKIRMIPIQDSRSFLNEIGIDGELLYTPGHSDDSVSLYLDEGIALVGDLNPLYELELHEGTQIAESWEKLLARNLKKVYYGHAKAAVLTDGFREKEEVAEKDLELYSLVQKIMKYIDKGYYVDKIHKKTRADKSFIEDVNRMYLTHQNVGVQGILDRIEIKNR